MMGAPPEYKVDRDDSLAPKWYEWRYWSKKIWMMIGVGIAIVIAIVIVVAVMVSKKDRYPDYSKLNYSLAETCAYASPIQHPETNKSAHRFRPGLLPEL
jgi:hypothetical protein